MDRLTIHVANEFHSECQQRHLTLYTPYWLINESCLQLCLKSKGTSLPSDVLFSCVIRIEELLQLLYTGALGPKLISRSSAPMPVAMQHGNLQLSLPTKRATWSRPITVSSIGLKGSVSIVVPKSVRANRFTCTNASSCIIGIYTIHITRVSLRRRLIGLRTSTCQTRPFTRNLLTLSLLV